MAFDSHPERFPVDGHFVLGLIAPRALAIATGHTDFESDMIFANEMNIKETMNAYKLLGASNNLRNVYRYGGHHGFDDITTYFDWFDYAFGRQTRYQQAMAKKGTLTADSLLKFPLTWLTPAGFDWETWNSTCPITRKSDPNKYPSLHDRIKWMLSLEQEGTDDYHPFSMGGTRSETEESSYIARMLEQVPSQSSEVKHVMCDVLHPQTYMIRQTMKISSPYTKVKWQPFGFGGWLSGNAYWHSRTLVLPDYPQPTIIWLHPYSYNTGFAPSYRQARIWQDLASAGYLVLTYDQVEHRGALAHEQVSIDNSMRWDAYSNNSRVRRLDAAFETLKEVHAFTPDMAAVLLY